MKRIFKKIIICTLLFGLALYCFIPGKDYNSRYKLNIVSSYGDDEAYHPKILSFDEKWNGYKYWMSYTPYPSGDAAKENPHIVVSNDLVTWSKVFDVDRPLNSPESDIPSLRYNSDSHIVYNNTLDRLEIYWRYVDDINKDMYLYRMYTEDGINWSEKEVSAYSPVRRNVDYVSPAIIYENGTYKMWYVDQNLTIKYTTSPDGINWENPLLIDFKFVDDVHAWHLDVINSDLGYEMIIVGFDEVENRNNMNLYYSKSEDGISWTKADIILSPTSNTGYWDNRGIYRSSFVKINGVYLLYYGGTSEDLHHGIGLVYGKNIYKLKPTNTNFNNKDERDILAKRIRKLINENN